jgi:hypothetical protein
MSIAVSTSNLTEPRPSLHDTPLVARPRGGMASSHWAWMTLACLLLGASGGVRAWQDLRFTAVENMQEAQPFPLKELPATLGDGEWRVQDGGEASLDPEVAQVAGCTDSLIRTYRNATTGVSVTALILFGPGTKVVGHTPEICYPSAGYQMVEGASSRTIALDAPLPAAEFRSEVFARARDQRPWREEVYYAFRHGNRWTPDAYRQWKDFRHHPSMFKVQVQRPVAKDERRTVNNPTEQFLALLIPEIEGRIAQSRSGRRE